MPFDYSANNVTPGRTVPVIMNDLPRDRYPDPDDPEQVLIGEYPVAHIEALGPDNRTWIASQIETADPKKVAPKKAKAKKPNVDDFLENTAESNANRRKEIHHAVRRIDCRHRDGKPAVPDDIPDWIAALPQHAVDRLWTIAYTTSYFYDGNFSDPKAVAEK